MNKASEAPIILFDGVCSLCNGFVDFIIKRDKKNQFYFASLQSETGIRYLEKFDLLDSNIDSIVYVQESQCWTKSTAVLQIMKSFQIPWSYLYFLIFIPTGIRNKIYDIIANNRYRWFGKKDACRMPTPEEKKRFL